jgi:hypothetical protein
MYVYMNYLTTNPDQTSAIDPFADWMASATLIPATSFAPRRGKPRFIPAIPIEFIQKTLQAGDALAVLLVAVMETRMRGVDEVALGRSVWSKVGSPSKRVRSRLLRQISRLPVEVCVLVSRQGRPHLLQTGPAWPKAAKKTGFDESSQLYSPNLFAVATDP